MQLGLRSEDKVCWLENSKELMRSNPYASLVKLNFSSVSQWEIFHTWKKSVLSSSWSNERSTCSGPPRDPLKIPLRDLWDVHWEIHWEILLVGIHKVNNKARASVRVLSETLFRPNWVLGFVFSSDSYFISAGLSLSLTLWWSMINDHWSCDWRVLSAPLLHCIQTKPHTDESPILIWILFCRQSMMKSHSYTRTYLWNQITFFLIFPFSFTFHPHPLASNNLNYPFTQQL